jgi:hypothetical protein
LSEALIVECLMALHNSQYVDRARGRRDADVMDRLSQHSPQVDKSAGFIDDKCESGWNQICATRFSLPHSAYVRT